MGVNSAFTGLFSSRRGYRLAMSAGAAIVIFAMFMVASSFSKPSDRVMRSKEVNLLVRQIGHTLLLQSGDKTSRVQPVVETREGTFVLSFERPLVFSHDSLMALAQSLLPKSKFPAGYTVTVHDCTQQDIVYGFRINSNTPDILACQGRREPAGCYTIEFALADIYENDIDYAFIGLAGSGMALTLCVGLLIGRFGKNGTTAQIVGEEKPVAQGRVVEASPLGRFLFDVQGQRLLLGSEIIALTEKECKILELLHGSFGELVPRETLMQKVWINEGVITGRSLDMFVSKLRKKLSGDDRLRITNVHGKGYRLEAQSPHH